MLYKALYNDFSFGQVNPFSSGKINSDLYNKSALEIRNFIVRPDGSLMRRNGTQMLVSGDMAGIDTVRLYQFSYSDRNVIAVFYPGYVRFYTYSDASGMERYKDANNDDLLPLATPYDTATKIDALCISSYGGDLYVTTKGVAPRMITYTDDAWAISTITFTGDYTFDTEGMYPSINFFKGMRLWLAGCPDKPTTLFASRTPSDNATRFTDFTMQDQYLVTTTFTTVKKYSSDPNEENPTVTYTANTSDETRETYTGQTTGTSDTSTLTETSEDGKGNTVWTVTTTYYVKSVENSVLANHAIEINEVDNAYGSKIMWAISAKRMLVGYGRSIMMDSGDVATPADFDLNTTVQDGCGSVTPVGIGSYVIYTGINNMSVKIMKYDYENDAYVNTDISTNISELIHDAGGVVELESQLAPFPIIWVLLADGTMLACTFDVDSGIIAWTLQSLGTPLDETVTYGKVKSVCVNQLSSGNEFLVLAVRRKDGIILERLGCDTPADISGSNFLDSSVRVDGVLSLGSSVTIPDHCVGYPCSVVADDAFVNTVDATTSGTTVTPKHAVGSYYRCGIVEESVLHLHPAEWLQATGPMLFKKRCLMGVTVRLYKSLSFKLVATDNPGTHAEPVFTRYAIDKYGAPTALFTGNYREDFRTEVTNDVTLIVTSDSPFPLNILAIVVDTDYKEA